MPNDFLKEQARRRATQLANKATPAMVKYLEQLLIDCRLADRVPRNAFLSRECEREIKALDELTFDETRELIDYLKDLKARNRNNVEVDEPEEDKDWNRR